MKQSTKNSNNYSYFQKLEDQDLFVGEILNNRYQIIKQISSSRVYLCSDLEKSNKLYAIKVCPKEQIYNEEFNLRREYIIHSQFDSKHIVATDEAIETEDKFAFLMEYVGGGDLSDLISSKGVLPISMVIEIFKKVALALKNVHEKGFIHADIKPENILISSSKEILLTDFGLARDVKFIKNFDKETKGTLKYLCPNYLTTGELNYSSDLFSLGLVAYEMLTGKVPFESKNIMDTLKERVYENSPSLYERNKDCPRIFSKIVSRCLSLSKTDRYESASDLVRDLEDVKTLITKKSNSRIKLFKQMPAKRRQGTLLSVTEKTNLKLA
jgi:serine/threonine protein kinase